MPEEPETDYLTVREASKLLGVSPGQVRRVLREYGLGEFMRASVSKEVLIRREDLEKIFGPIKQRPKRWGAA